MAAMDSAPQPLVETLYLHHHAWLRQWLHRRLGSAWDAADLAHESYVRLMASGRLPVPADSRRYLVQIARGLVLDLHRRRAIEAAYRETLAALPPARVPSEETRALAIEALVEVDALLNHLPPKARSALLMCRLEGLAYREIAKRLGVSVSSVEKYIAAALNLCLQVLHDGEPQGAQRR